MAVARLSQGMSPKHCALPLRGRERLAMASVFDRVFDRLAAICYQTARRLRRWRIHKLLVHLRMLQQIGAFDKQTSDLVRRMSRELAHEVDAEPAGGERSSRGIAANESSGPANERRRQMSGRGADEAWPPR